MIPMGKDAFSQEPQVIPELTSAGSSPYMRKHTAAPFMNREDIWPKPKRQDMAKPTEPELHSLKRRLSLKVNAMGAARAALALGDGMRGVRINPEKASAIVFP